MGIIMSDGERIKERSKRQNFKRNMKEHKQNTIIKKQALQLKTSTLVLILTPLFKSIKIGMVQQSIYY